MITIPIVKMNAKIKTKKKPKLSLLDLKPKDWGKGTERLSEEIDMAAYD